MFVGHSRDKTTIFIKRITIMKTSVRSKTKPPVGTILHIFQGLISAPQEAIYLADGQFYIPCGEVFARAQNVRSWQLKD
jgi:hypothetical protein